jgi:hypothetical protein
VLRLKETVATSFTFAHLSVEGNLKIGARSEQGKETKLLRAFFSNMQYCTPGNRKKGSRYVKKALISSKYRSFLKYILSPACVIIKGLSSEILGGGMKTYLYEDDPLRFFKKSI